MRIGFAKLAVTDPPDDTEDNRHLARNVAMGGALALPWAGTIGEQPLKHYRGGVEAKSLEEIKKMFRPGDIIVQGDKEIDPFKIFSGLSTGQPETLHIEAVGRRGRTYAAGGGGMEHGTIADFVPKKTRLQLLRPRMTPQEIQEQLANMEQGLKTTSTFDKHFTRALRKEKLSPEIVEKLRGVMGNATYNTYGGAAAAVKNVLMPKLRSPEAIDAAKQHTIDSRTAFNANQGGAADTAAQAAIARLKRFRHLKKLPQSAAIFQSQITPECVGSVCTSFPAQALPKGKYVVPGKLHSELLGADYLRSNLYEPVAHYGFRGPAPVHERLLRAGPTALRLGTGAALAGGVYGASKLLERYRNRGQKDSTAPG